MLGGSKATLLLIGTVVVSDSAQYYTGRAFGRRPLAPASVRRRPLKARSAALCSAPLFMALAGRWSVPRPAARRWRVLGVVLRRARHPRRSVRVAAEARRRREGQFGADSRTWRRARSHRRAAVCDPAVLLRARCGALREEASRSSARPDRSAAARSRSSTRIRRGCASSALAAGDNAALLAEQVRRYRPAIAAMATPEAVDRLRAACGADAVRSSEAGPRV